MGKVKTQRYIYKHSYSHIIWSVGYKFDVKCNYTYVVNYKRSYRWNIANVYDT